MICFLGVTAETDWVCDVNATGREMHAGILVWLLTVMQYIGLQPIKCAGEAWDGISSWFHTVLKAFFGHAVQIINALIYMYFAIGDEIVETQQKHILINFAATCNESSLRQHTERVLPGRNSLKKHSYWGIKKCKSSFHM